MESSAGWSETVDHRDYWDFLEVNVMPEKSKEQLINELNCFLAHGYLDMDSYDEPLDEAAGALIALKALDEQVCISFCKEILLSECFGDDFLDGFCLGYLFDIEKEFALKYIESHVENMSAPILDDAMSGLSQYSQTPFCERFSKELIAKIYHRYDELSKDPFYKKILEVDYSHFQKDFPRQDDKV